MPKPRKFVRIIDQPDGTLRRVEKGGREIHGLSYARTSKPGEPERGSFYVIDGGKRKHLSADLAEAVQAMEPDKPYWTPERTRLADSQAELEARILDLTVPRAGQPAPSPAEAQRKLNAMLASVAEPAAVPSKEKLSDCLAYWRTWKTEQEREPEYLDETERNFKELIAVVGDKPANQITKADIVAFERHLNRNAESNDWYARRVKSLRGVFNLCIKKDSLPLPDGLAKWLAAIESRPVVPDATNKKALPPEIFKAMIRICEQWAALDVDAMPKETQADKARRNRAWERKRNAVQFLAILKLSCQAGFGSKDVCRLEWTDFHLDAKQPYIDFSRGKSAWRTGVATARVIPLLPATVKALKAWRDYETPNGLAFRNSQRGQWKHDHIARNFGIIKKASKHDSFWSFKHLRNIPGNVGRDAKLADWIAQATLGHTPSSLIGKRYIDDPQPAALLPLVKAIAARYFA